VLSPFNPKVGFPVDGHIWFSDLYRYYRVFESTASMLILLQAVSPAEYGNYTCYSKHLEKMTWNAKSVLLVVRSDWQKLWEDDEVRPRKIQIRISLIANCCTNSFSFDLLTSAKHYFL
jgi:hypothetical protein